MDDVTKVVKTAVLVGVASALTFIAANVGEIEMGENLLILLPMVTMGLQTAIKWVQDLTKSDDTDDTPDEEV